MVCDLVHGVGSGWLGRADQDEQVPPSVEAMERTIERSIAKMTRGRTDGKGVWFATRAKPAVTVLRRSR